MDAELKTKVKLKERTLADVINPQLAKITELKESLAKAKKDTEAALDDQGELEKRLYKVQEDLGDKKLENEKLEREIRALELGRNRGGRQ